METPAIIGLATGTAFLILFAVTIPDSLRSENNAFNANDMAMPASYFLNDCNPPSGVAIVNETGIEIKERNWISVVRVAPIQDSRVGNSVPCTILTPNLLSEIPALSGAVNGANGCFTRTEVCEVSYGISGVGDDDDYELTITKLEAARILTNIELGQYNRALLADGENFYLLSLISIEEGTPLGAQIEAKFLEPFPESPVQISAGQILNYTLVLKTWATYGGSATIDLIAFISGRDSGIQVELQPANLEMSERSEAKSVLRLAAAEDLKEGVYDLSIGGRINDFGLLPEGPCDYGGCEIKVGESDWRIQTYGGDMYIGLYGPGIVPDWIWLELKTNRETYLPGEEIKIEAFLVNNGTENVILDGGSRLVITVGEQGSGSASYSIDAINDTNNAMIVEPKSKMLLARSFAWDQGAIMPDGDTHQVAGGTYNVAASFAGYGNAVLYGNYEITINSFEN